jgi:hypothetical protein
MNVTGARNYNPLGYEALAPTSATKMDVPNGAKYALITAEVQHVRMTDDGTTPTLTVGLVVKTTDPPLWYAGNLSKVQFFNDTAGGLIKILYYG